MTEKDKKFMRSWEKAIKLGRLKYALIYGLIYTVFTYLFSSLFIYFFDRNVYQINRIIIQLSIFYILGFFMFYYLFWKANTSKYKSLKNKY